MQMLDTTIANVALPHMQGSLSASQDQIAWVLTSYIVAAAIATPLRAGWATGSAARRWCRWRSPASPSPRRLCGMATSLPEIVVFRFIQGLFGAALIPLSQSIMLDINPREKVGQAMAIWGAGIMVGADPRADAGRLDHRQLFLALGVLHQRAVRHHRVLRHPGLHARRRARAAPAVRFHRLRAA